MATTNTWSSGTGLGSFLDGSLWSLNIAPAAGQFDVVSYGEPTLSDAAVDGFTIDISSSQAVVAAAIIDKSTFGNGILLEDTGSTNGGSMLLEGQVTNDGTFLFNGAIPGEFNGFSLDFDNNKATLTNNGVITIASSDGLFLGNGDGGTLINNGAIFDELSRTFFNSPVDGTGTIGLVAASLELSAGATLGADQTILFADGKSTLAFNNTGGTVSNFTEATVLDFQKGDILDFPELFLVSPGLSYNASTRTLSVPTDNGTLDVVMGGSTAYTLRSFTEGPDTNDGFEIGTTAPPCFAAGTRILTARGEVPVEHLEPDEPIALLGGGTAPLRWLGHRRVDCARHPRPWDVLPVRIEAGAFGGGLPRRNLKLSPDHAVFASGVLIPVRYLINGATIAQIDAGHVAYFHVELPQHAVLFAEGLPAESFLDTGNRGAFANGGGPVNLHPDFSRRIWQARGCAELVVTGPRLRAARQRLLHLAGALGHAMTDDPALCVTANGRVMPMESDGLTHRVRLPAGTRAVRLAARIGVPAHRSPDGGGDHRRLGVAVSRVRLDGQDVGLADARLGAGWHRPEGDGTSGRWRWTDGNAALAVDGRRDLEIEVAMSERYWVRQTEGRAAKA